MHSDRGNPEILADIPEPLKIRGFSMYRFADDSMGILRANYQVEEELVPAQEVPAAAEHLATVTDLNQYKQSMKPETLPEQEVPLQTSRAAEDNKDELDHLRRVRELTREAHDQATPAEQQQLQRGLPHAS